MPLSLNRQKFDTVDINSTRSLKSATNTSNPNSQRAGKAIGMLGSQHAWRQNKQQTNIYGTNLDTGMCALASCIRVFVTVLSKGKVRFHFQKLG